MCWFRTPRHTTTPWPPSGKQPGYCRRCCTLLKKKHNQQVPSDRAVSEYLNETGTDLITKPPGDQGKKWSNIRAPSSVVWEEGVTENHQAVEIRHVRQTCDQTVPAIGSSDRFPTLNHLKHTSSKTSFVLVQPVKTVGCKSTSKLLQ